MTLKPTAKTMIALDLRFAQYHLLAVPGFRGNPHLLCPPLAPSEVCAGIGVWLAGVTTIKLAQK